MKDQWAHWEGEGRRLSPLLLSTCCQVNSCSQAGGYTWRRFLLLSALGEGNVHRNGKENQIN